MSMNKSGKNKPKKETVKELNDQAKNYFAVNKPKEAIKTFKKALRLYPNDYRTWFNLGLAYQKQNKFREAIRCYNRNITLFGENPHALKNLAVCYGLVGDKEKTLEIIKILNFDGDRFDTYFNLGTVYSVHGDPTNAIESYKKAIELNPHFALSYGRLFSLYLGLCDWDEAEKLTSSIKKFNKQAFKEGKLACEMPYVNVIRTQDLKDNYLVAKSRTDQLMDSVNANPVKFLFDREKKKKVLRISYLSCDYHDHATVHLILGLFRNHNRKKFKIYAHSHGVEDKSDYRKEVVKSVDCFRDIAGLNDKEAALAIYRDKIDILVDLKGHTNGNRLAVALYRPTPINLTWLGFPGTTGSNRIDYIVSDKKIIKPSEEKYYSEKVVYMPDTYQINDDKQKISGKNFKILDFGLPEDKFIFSSFTQPYKISRDTFDNWINILKKVPNSVLWLYEKEPLAIKNLRLYASLKGVRNSRLIFSPRLPKDEHLKRLSLSDLALDTFTYNGHTTTSDSLWAGVPVVTLKGNHFASRVSSSLLSSAGLPELITKTKKEYCDKAILLATNQQKLESLRKKVETKAKKSALFDSRGFTRNLEKAYTTMYQNYVSGVNPQKIVIN